MSRRKTLAVLAAATAAIAAVPATSASAASTRNIVSPIPYAPPAFLCSGLVFQLQTAEAVGNPLLANLIGQTLMDVGCGGAAI
jgi:hypothetical protein